MKGKQQQDFRVEKYIRYGIRKYSFGAASVAIAAGLMFLGSGAVSATEVQGAEASVAATTAPANQADPNKEKEAVKPETKVAEAKPEVKAEKSKPEETPKEVVAPKLDKTQLEAYVNQVAGNIAAGKYANKTDESLALLNADLEAAKAALSSATSQDELKAAYNKLVTTVNSKLQNKPVEKKETPAVDTTNGKETVGKKAENTEKKSESNAIENTGSKDERNGKELVQGSHLRSANEGYTASSKELRKENGEFLGSTGKSYKVLDGNANYKIYVHGYQSENTDVPAANSGQAGTSGRTDIPLSKTEAQKVGREAELWKGKLRATGKPNNNNVWGAGGAYEYLATEIYGYTYEQGNHYVYVTDVKKRFSLSPEATAAGYTIANIEASNLPPGLAYNATTDTVEGYVASTLQNGVYDMRYIVTVEKGGATQQVTFRDLTAGWVGWQDSSAPLIQGKSKLVTVGDQVNHNIKYVDNDGMTRDERAGYVYRSNGEKVVAGSKTAPGGTNGATFTAVDGSKVNTENGPQTVTAHTALNGNYTGSKTSINDVVPGLSYNPKNGDITGTASEAGIFTASVYAKDYNNTTNARNMDWNMYGQEAHENITIAVAPKITVKNVEAYATNVPVTISKGANKAEITMPDGTVTKLEVKDGNWTVAAGTTNTAVQEGAVLGAASTTGDSTFNLTVTPESTKYVGVDNIVAKATTDKVKANIQREFAMVTDAAGNTYKAVFNRATGKYSLPTEKAYELKDNGNGTSTLIERRVYTDAQANGDVKFVVYEFERTWNATSSAATLVDKIAEIRKNGEVTAVGAVTRTETLVKKDNTSSEQGMVVTVSYDSVTNQWTSSDGTAVTAKESNAGWEIETASGFKGYVAYREASSTDLASIHNDKPTGTSTSYSEAKDTSVDLVKSPKANVAFADTIDDKTTAADSDTIKTKVTVTAPDGTVTNFDGAQAEETAYIQAQRTAAAKTQAAATAVKEYQDTQNELARLQELLDRSTRTVEDAQAALDDLKLRTISPTAQELAERKLANVKEFKASIEAQLATAQTNLSTKNTEVESTRTAALEAEKAVETARTALKTAAEANLAKANAYVLSQKGRYKVTVSAVDSNGVVTTPTVGGTNTGEVTEDAVAETTYYIVVTEPEKSSGAQGQKQTDSMADNFNDGKEGTTVSNYKLVDPKTGAKVESVTTDEGTYTVDPNTGEVTFTPVEGFVGTANPVTVAADVTFNDESGNPVTVAVENSYTPTVYGIAPSADETTGKQGQPQTSKSGKDRFSELNNTDNTLDGTNVDWTTAAYSLEGANAEGKVVVDGEGTYSIDPTTGVVTFEPLPTFTGKAKGVNVQVSVTATDSEGNKVPVTSKGKYTPEVTPVTPTGEDVTSTGKQGQEQTGKPVFTQGDETAPITINEQQPAKFVVNGQPVDDKEIPATKDGKEIGKYVIDPLTGVVTFKPNKDFVGTPDPATVEVKDKNGTPATATYTPTVTPVVPTATPKETTGKQGQPQTQETESMFKQGDEVAPIDKTTVKLVDPSGNEVTTMPAMKDGKEVGTYTIDPMTGVITFQPNKDFVGTPDPAKVVAKDTNGTKVETTYTPTVTPVVPTAEPKETKDVQGATQTGKPTFTPGADEVPMDDDTPATFEDGSKEKVIPGEGTYTVAPDGTVTFVPEKTFTGTGTGVTVKRVDKNGTPVTAKYTPTVLPATPTATPAETTDIQGALQKGLPQFLGGRVSVDGVQKIVPIDETKPLELIDPSTGKVTNEIVVPGEGTYTVYNGVVEFRPEPQFVGKAKGVTVQRVDVNGTPVSTTYTPNVTPVTPTAEPAETTDIQGKEQTGKPEFKPGNPNVPMNDEVPATFEDGSTTKTIPGEGTYKVNPDGTVTFTPEKNFTGKGTGVTVKRVDKNGTPVTAKYTPTVTPVTPEGTPAETTDIQGKEQNGKPEFKPGNPEVPMDDEVPATFEDGSTTKTIPGEGTYTVSPDGTVTFTPEKNFTGKGTGVTVKRVDKNGTPVTAKYTPNVTPVTPTADPVETTDIQGKEQTGKPEFKPGNPEVPMDDEVPATFEDGSTEKVIPGEGTYKVNPDGTVTFTPEKTFTGKGTGVTVKRVDKNGTPVTAKYTPTVTPVTPEGTPAETTDIQGKEQNGKPEFKPGNPEVPMDDEVPATFEDGSTEKVIPGEGTYTVSPDGTVTFTPEKTFTGKGTGVTVKRVDKNGTPVTAKYTPTVTPVTPEGTPAESEGPKGQPQTGTPEFKPGNPNVPIDETVKPTFDDGTTEKKVPGEGTYTIDENGKVTFTPEPDFVGKATGVTVKRVDKNGTPVTATYTPTVRPDTSFVDKDGNPLSPTEDGTKPTKDIPGYKIVKTEVDEKGNTKHIYEKVTTTHKDKDGNVIPGTTTEEGTTPKKDIPGYRFVETKKLPNGDTEHVYEKVKTSHKDKDGNEIPNYPTEDGEQPKKDIPGYRFVETKKLPNGDIEHVYEKVKTSFKDKDGNEIPGNPSEDGEQPKKDIPGYRFVETKKLPNGDIEHVYEKVKTSHKDKDGNEIPNYPTEDGEQPKKDIPGYRFVETKKLPNGDIEHVYEKVKTSFKDKEGNEIPGNPSEDGEQPKKDIPGYRFVETKKLPNGDTEHVYEKVKTSFKDKEGNEIPGNPSEDGEQPKKDIPGYRFVETKKLPNGDTEHVYEKVKTSFKDKEGNEIPGNPSEDGEQPKKNIPGYRFVETKKLPNGDVEHVYEKVKTSHKDKDGNEIPNYPTEDGEQPKKDIPGYRFVETKKLPNGDTVHVYEKIIPSVKPEPAKPSKPAPAKPAKELPNTGTEDHSSLAALGLLGVLSGFGLVARKKKED
ncbi:YSIRK-type signal peptide-containing protein [Streptococcus mitis]|uniref:YSIRK type signal peptide n=2 Tax=Streptococcus TaxID=1301 RepID=A0A3R9M4L8_STRMT|nr:YSIRK-type signal peptide-containing protein [Streptococcus mitis]RSJ91349.1 YSIRK type signal peptide [Streptococcus mitis]